MNARRTPTATGLRTATRSLLTILLLLAAFAVAGCENGCAGDEDDETAMHDEGMMTEDEDMHDEGMMAEDETGAMHDEGAMGNDAMHDEAPMDSTAHRGGGMGGGR